MGSATTIVSPQPPPGFQIGIPIPTLTATAVSSSQINLNAAYAGPPSLATYTFTYALALAGPWMVLTKQTSANFSHTNLISSTPYFYQVNVQTLETASRNSLWSTTASATTASAALPSSGGPLILYTDIVDGPLSGGENNLGCYLSIYGLNFGTFAAYGTTNHVTIGGHEVANYRCLQNAAGSGAGANAYGKGVYETFGIQRLTVQVGAIGSPAFGTALPVSLTVNGIGPSNALAGGVYQDVSGNNLTFTPNQGRIVFVDPVSGVNPSPASGADGVTHGSITTPLLTLQSGSSQGSLSGALWDTRSQSSPSLTGACFAGTHIILRGTGTYAVNGYNSRWARFTLITGCPSTAAANSGYIVITGYPGPAGANTPENPKFVGPSGNNGGINWCQSSWGTGGGITTPYPNLPAQGYGQYTVVSNLSIQPGAAGASDSAPINWQTGANFQRLVNNNLTSPSNTGTPLAGGAAGDGFNMSTLGNYVHDILGGSGSENHGIYYDGENFAANNVECAYNVINNVGDGNGIQTYNDGIGGASPNFTNMNMHHNWVQGVSKHGLNLSSGTQSGRWWNNVVVASGNAAISLNTSNPVSANDLQIVNNTLLGWSTSGSFSAIYNQASAPANSELVENNVCVQLAGSTAGSFYTTSGGVNLTNNMWFDLSGRLTTKPSQDTLGTYTNPLLVSGALATINPQVQQGSPAINKAVTTGMSFVVEFDFFLALQPYLNQPNNTLGACVGAAAQPTKTVNPSIGNGATWTPPGRTQSAVNYQNFINVVAAWAPGDYVEIQAPTSGTSSLNPYVYQTQFVIKNGQNGTPTQPIIVTVRSGDFVRLHVQSGALGTKAITTAYTTASSIWTVSEWAVGQGLLHFEGANYIYCDFRDSTGVNQALEIGDKSEWTPNATGPAFNNSNPFTYLNFQSLTIVSSSHCKLQGALVHGGNAYNAGYAGWDCGYWTFNAVWFDRHGTNYGYATQGGAGPVEAAGNMFMYFGHDSLFTNGKSTYCGHDTGPGMWGSNNKIYQWDYSGDWTQFTTGRPYGYVGNIYSGSISQGIPGYPNSPYSSAILCGPNVYDSCRFAHCGPGELNGTPFMGFPSLNTIVRNCAFVGGLAGGHNVMEANFSNPVASANVLCVGRTQFVHNSVSGTPGIYDATDSGLTANAHPDTYARDRFINNVFDGNTDSGSPGPYLIRHFQTTTFCGNNPNAYPGVNKGCQVISNILNAASPSGNADSSGNTYSTTLAFGLYTSGASHIVFCPWTDNFSIFPGDVGNNIFYTPQWNNIGNAFGTLTQCLLGMTLAPTNTKGLGAATFLATTTVSGTNLTTITCSNACWLWDARGIPQDSPDFVAFYPILGGAPQIRQLAQNTINYTANTFQITTPYSPSFGDGLRMVLADGKTICLNLGINYAGETT